EALKKKGYTKFVFENQKTATAASEKMKINVLVKPSSGAGSFFRENLAKIIGISKATIIEHLRNPEVRIMSNLLAGY
ncbi:MAG: hypothetical protein P8Y70_17260, partial [Candidatus Lokiarchaeota archaeon]